jgi:hypothetical protein
MRQKTQEAGLHLDDMLMLVYPDWQRGNVVYDPGTGEIRELPEQKQ